ncbi:ankyrin repeat-containing domain protein, partial [Rhypophila decipiens]
VEFMIGLGSHITAMDYQGWTPVHYAARYNAERVINYLVNERGLAPDAVGFFGKTPAHIAAMLDNVEAFKALFLSQGGCEMSPDNAGYSPIDVAFQQGSSKILHFLRHGLGMGTGRAIPHDMEKKSMEMMKTIWENHPEWNVCFEWVQGVPDGVPRKVNLRGQWEAEQFPEEHAKRRRIG